MSQRWIFFLIHAVLALAPIGMRFVPANLSALPLLWALASVNLAQLMLLSIYVAMFTGSFLNRLLVATGAILYIGICQMIGESGMSSRDPFDFVRLYLSYVGMDFSIVVVLSVLLVLARKGMGSIRRVDSMTSQSISSRPQFSLLAVLLLLSISALVMALVRSSRMANQPGDHTTLFVLLYVLLTVVFGINIIATIWATLGAGFVPGKLTTVFVVSVVLGLAIGLGVGHDSYGWLLAGSTLMTIVPTTIIALTLLSLRSTGFRLSRFAIDAPPEEAETEQLNSP